jgi:hypothetical protein
VGSTGVRILGSSGLGRRGERGRRDGEGAVERHNGVDGDRFRSGISRGVMGENVLRPLRKQKGEGHREAAMHV